MIVTEFNEMTCNELLAAHEVLGTRFIINDGKIVGTENIPATDRKSEQG